VAQHSECDHLNSMRFLFGFGPSGTLMSMGTLLHEKNWIKHEVARISDACLTARHEGESRIEARWGWVQPVFRKNREVDVLLNGGTLKRAGTYSCASLVLPCVVRKRETS
jgi:hypothetical protein